MRRLVGFALIALALTLAGVSSFATAKQSTKQVAAAPTEITGEVTGIMLKVKDKAGKTHIASVTDPNVLEGLKIGDNVDVKLEKGKAASIEKVESKAPAEDASGTK